MKLISIRDFAAGLAMLSTSIVSAVTSDDQSKLPKMVWRKMPSNWQRCPRTSIQG